MGLRGWSPFLKILKKKIRMICLNKTLLMLAEA